MGVKPPPFPLEIARNHLLSGLIADHHHVGLQYLLQFPLEKAGMHCFFDRYIKMV